uniref:Mediator of RNA polymerase II transcription subunit 7 n=1 Tax=Elaeophora elaphi TaxID=1147741 RepID=A0A0R3S187_9BILA
MLGLSFLFTPKEEKLVTNVSLYHELTGSPKPNYVQNGKVHFERLGHLNEELEFRRNPVPPQLPTLLSKKDLLSKLSKRNKHLEQIADNAAEIVDIPEEEYADYKDAVSQFFFFEFECLVLQCFAD